MAEFKIRLIFICSNSPNTVTQAKHCIASVFIVKLRVRVRVRVRVKVKVKVKVKSLKSKLDPVVGSVMGWPTTHHHHHPPPYNFF